MAKGKNWKMRVSCLQEWIKASLKSNVIDVKPTQEKYVRFKKH